MLLAVIVLRGAIVIFFWWLSARQRKLQAIGSARTMSSAGTNTLICPLGSAHAMRQGRCRPGCQCIGHKAGRPCC